MLKEDYPVNWPALAREIKEICGWTCMECGMVCRRPDEPFDSHKRTLTVAHITQDYQAAVVQVACLCSICHLRHDAPYSWVARLRWQRWRRWQAGQLLLDLRLS